MEHSFSIRDLAGAKGKWDIAKIPGEGGNWGGSHLAVPAQSKHPKEAYELAKFLTSKEGLIGAFKEKGPLPSSPQALDDPAVKVKVDDDGKVRALLSPLPSSLSHIHVHFRASLPHIAMARRPRAHHT